ncbi:MAG: YybH family protein [Acidobacteriota bacterium]
MNLLKIQTCALAVSLVLSSAILLSCAPPGEQESVEPQATQEFDAVRMRQHLEQVSQQFSEAVRQGDAAAIGNFYAQDATLLPPNHEIVEGRQAIQDYWNSFFQMGPADATLTTVEVDGSGNLAYEVGQFTMSIQPEGQQAITDSGKFVVVWTRQDGMQEMGAETAAEPGTAETLETEAGESGTGEAGADQWKIKVDIWNSSQPQSEATPSQTR